MIITLSTIECKADLIVNSLWKYGVNGYNSSGVDQSSTKTTSSKTHGVTTTNSTTTSTNNMSIDNRYQLTPGLGIEVVPQYDGVCVGAGYYMDNTIQMNLGWKIF